MTPFSGTLQHEFDLVQVTLITEWSTPYQVQRHVFLIWHSHMPNLYSGIAFDSWNVESLMSESLKQALNLHVLLSFYVMQTSFKIQLVASLWTVPALAN